MGKEKTGGLTRGRGHRLLTNVLNEIVELIEKCIHTSIHRPVNLCCRKKGKLAGDIFYEFPNGRKDDFFYWKAIKC
jgi:hypothetical protein